MDEIVGSGSFGDVVQESDKYVIKTYRNVPDDEYAMASFIREVSVLSYMKMVSIPGTLKLFDVKQNQMKLNLMQTDLRMFIHHARQRRIHYMSKLLTSVNQCHISGILHRDIKPSNILVDTVKKKLILCDFGTAYMYYIHNNESSIIKIKKSTSYTTKVYLHPKLMGGKQLYYKYEMDAWSILMIWADLLNLSFWTNLLMLPDHSEKAILKYYENIDVDMIKKEMIEKSIYEEEMNAFCKTYTMLMDMDFSIIGRSVMTLYEIFDSSIFVMRTPNTIYTSSYFVYSIESKDTYDHDPLIMTNSEREGACNWLLCMIYKYKLCISIYFYILQLWNRLNSHKYKYVKDEMNDYDSMKLLLPCIIIYLFLFDLQDHVHMDTIIYEWNKYFHSSSIVITDVKQYIITILSYYHPCIFTPIHSIYCPFQVDHEMFPIYMNISIHFSKTLTWNTKKALDKHNDILCNMYMKDKVKHYKFYYYKH